MSDSSSAIPRALATAITSRWAAIITCAGRLVAVLQHPVGRPDDSAETWLAPDVDQELPPQLVQHVGRHDVRDARLGEQAGDPATAAAGGPGLVASPNTIRPSEV